MLPMTCVFKCQKCRLDLFDSSQLISTHGHSLQLVEENEFHLNLQCLDADQCPTGATIWYLREELVPDWVKQQLTAGEWTRGKLHCPNEKCGLRIGSFDFVHSMKCECGKCLLPPIRVVRSKVDGRIRDKTADEGASCEQIAAN